MTLTLLLIIFALAIFVSLMGLAIAIPVYPNIIRITESFVCPPGMKMKVEKVKLSYHRPSEKGIIVSCHGHGETRYVRTKALLYLWLIFFLFSLPIVARLGALIMNNE
jgi:hypothetical protein